MPQVRSERAGGNFTSPGGIEQPTGDLKTLDRQYCWAAACWPKRRLSAAGTGSCCQLSNLKHDPGAFGSDSRYGLAFGWRTCQDARNFPNRVEHVVHHAAGLIHGALDSGNPIIDLSDLLAENLQL